MQDNEYLASDVALQAADDLCLGQSLFYAALEVCLGSIVIAEPDDHHSMKGSIRPAVATTVETVAVSLT